jgi:hypothetical protein
VQVAIRVGEIAGPAEFEIDGARIHRRRDAATEIILHHARRYLEKIFADRDFAVAGLLRFGLAEEHDPAFAVEQDHTERERIELILAETFDLFGRLSASKIEWISTASCRFHEVLLLGATAHAAAACTHAIRQSRENFRKPLTRESRTINQSLIGGLGGALADLTGTGAAAGAGVTTGAGMTVVTLDFASVCLSAFCAVLAATFGTALGATA